MTATDSTPTDEFIGRLTMKEKELVDILKKLLETETDLSFLKKLDDHELQTLIACVRSRLDQG